MCIDGIRSVVQRTNRICVSRTYLTVMARRIYQSIRRTRPIINIAVTFSYEFDSAAQVIRL